MSAERQHLTEALKAVTDRVPMITRGILNAGKLSRPLDWRRHEFEISVSQTRALLDELLLHQVKLGWRDRGDDAA